MRVCFVVNKVQTQRPTYTTAYLAYCAEKRGHDVVFVSADCLFYGDDGQVRAEAVRAAPHRIRGVAEYTRALTSERRASEVINLRDVDVVFLRNNPQVAATRERFNPVIELGRRIKDSQVLVVNDPDGLARAGSKMYLAGFPAEIRPKTLITRSESRVLAFLREMDGPAIIKPLHGFGGNNVFYLGRGQTANLSQMISTVRQDDYLIVQEYLPAVARGDKRVLLLGGSPITVGGRVAAYKRMRPRDDIRNNMHVGGARRACQLSESERRLCELLRPRLMADGLYFVGVDIVGDKVLEINVFAPGGIHNIDELYGVDVASAVIKDLERKVELKTIYRDALPPHVMVRA